jgi:hypothetical protein
MFATLFIIVMTLAFLWQFFGMGSGRVKELRRDKFGFSPCSICDGNVEPGSDAVWDGISDRIICQRCVEEAEFRYQLEDDKKLLMPCYGCGRIIKWRVGEDKVLCRVCQK